jgi:hypothetical protein
MDKETGELLAISRRQAAADDLLKAVENHLNEMARLEARSRFNRSLPILIMVVTGALAAGTFFFGNQYTAMFFGVVFGLSGLALLISIDHSQARGRYIERLEERLISANIDMSWKRPKMGMHSGPSVTLKLPGE